MVDWTAIIIITGVCVVLPTVFAYIMFRSKDHEIDRKMDLLTKAVENGQEINPALLAREKPRKSKKMMLLNRLTLGVVLALCGGALFAGCPFVEDNVAMIIVASCVLAIGLALVGSFFLAKKWMAAELEADEKSFAAPEYRPRESDEE